jgi:branched-chain amino acid transport system substrate-binding protein
MIAGLTGASNTWSVPFSKGAELAVKDINAAGGVDGRQVELISEDNQSSPETSVNNVTKLMSSDKVDFIVCSCDSGQFVPIVTRIAQQNAQGGQFVVSNGVAGTSDILNLPPVYVSVFPLNPELSKQLVQVAYDNGARSAWVISGTDAYGQDMNKQLQATWQALGGTVAGDSVVNPGQADYNSVMRQINDANPDVIFTGTYGPDLTLQFREITELGNKAPWYLLYPQTAAIADLPNADGRGFGLSPAWLGLTGAAEWSAAYKQEYGEDPDLFAAQGYDNTRLAALAVANAKADTVDAIKEAYVTASSSYNGPTGTFEFDSTFARINSLVTWYQITGGKWVEFTP